MNGPLILLHEDDNVLVVRRPIAAGETLTLSDARIIAQTAIGVGHKLARHDLGAGARVVKFGAPIGSLKVAVARGELVHTHNLASDYIPTHLRTGRA